MPCRGRTKRLIVWEGMRNLIFIEHPLKRRAAGLQWSCYDANLVEPDALMKHKVQNLFGNHPCFFVRRTSVKNFSSLHCGCFIRCSTEQPVFDARTRCLDFFRQTYDFSTQCICERSHRIKKFLGVFRRSFNLIRLNGEGKIHSHCSIARVNVSG